MAGAARPEFKLLGGSWHTTGPLDFAQANTVSSPGSDPRMGGCARKGRILMATFAAILAAAGKSSRFADKNYKKPFAPLAGPGGVAARGRSISESARREADDRRHRTRRSRRVRPQVRREHRHHGHHGRRGRRASRRFGAKGARACEDRHRLCRRARCSPAVHRREVDRLGLRSGRTNRVPRFSPRRSPKRSSASTAASKSPRRSTANHFGQP